MSAEEKVPAPEVKETKSGDSKALSKVPLAGGARQGAKQWQEDSFHTMCSTNNKVLVGGIWDGHGGYNGMLASREARDFTEKFLDTNKTTMESWNVATWNEKLLQLFADTHEAIKNRFLNVEGETSNRRHVDEKGIVRFASQDPIHGGTTASLVVCIRPAASDLPDGKLVIITANCGDSTGLLVKVGDRKPEYLTVDHGPESKIEYDRVQALPAETHPTKLLFVYDKTNIFRKYECPTVFLPDGTKDQKYVRYPWKNGLHPTNVRYEPAVYAVTPQHITKDSTCIAMTRALGDLYAHQFGLTAIPSITTKILPIDGDYFICAGSDGIWDCWKYPDFASKVNTLLLKKGRPSTTAEVSEYILGESIHRAVKNFGSKHFDDASFVCWRICPGGKSEIEYFQEQEQPISL